MSQHPILITKHCFLNRPDFKFIKDIIVKKLYIYIYIWSYTIYGTHVYCQNKITEPFRQVSSTYTSDQMKDGGFVHIWSFWLRCVPYLCHESSSRQMNHNCNFHQHYNFSVMMKTERKWNQKNILWGEQYNQSFLWRSLKLGLLLLRSSSTVFFFFFGRPTHMGSTFRCMTNEYVV